MNNHDEHRELEGGSGPASPVERPSEPVGLAQDPVQKHVASVSRQIRATGTLFLDEIEQSAEGSLVSLFDRTESRLRQLVQESGLLTVTNNASQSDAASIWRGIKSYRKSLQSDVVAVIGSALTEMAMFSHVSDRFEATVDALSKLDATLPEKIERTEPEGVYNAVASDPTLLRASKFLVRTQRKLGSLGKPKSRDQRVFLRAVVRAHTLEMLPQLLLNRSQLGLHKIGVAVGNVERDLTRLMHELLIAEVKLDKPEYHIPDTDELPKPTEKPEGEKESTPEGDNQKDIPGTHEEILAHIQAYNANLMRSLADARSLDLGEWKHASLVLLDEALTELGNDVDRSDSFLASNVLQRGVDLGSTSESELQRLPHRWTAWYVEVVSRLAFCESLSKLRDQLAVRQAFSIKTAIVAGIIPAANAHRNAAAELQHLHDQAQEFLRDALNQYGVDVMVDQLQKLLDRSNELIETDLIEQSRKQHISEVLVGDGQKALEEVGTVADQFSDGFTVHPLLGETDTRVDLDDDTRSIDLHTILLDAFTDTFSQAYSRASNVLTEQSERISLEDREILAVIRFNIGAGIEELQGAKTKTPGDAESANPLSDAASASSELTLNGLARSRDALLAQRDSLAPVVLEVAANIFEAYKGAWLYIHELSRPENQMHQAIVSARSQLTGQGRQVITETSKRLDTLRSRLRKVTRIGKKRAEQLVALGQEAVGAQVQQAEAFQETMLSLTATDDIIEAAPLVYRRLFTFNPLADPDLLEGRTEDKRRVVKHIQTWRRGLPQALLITGAPSSGITSFLNVLSTTVFRQFDVSQLEFLSRVSDEAVLTKKIFSSLEFSATDIPVQPKTLDELTTALLALPPRETLKVCLIEHLEHLFLRKIGGMQLMSDFLTMISRTDSKILWVLTISDFGWQLVEKSQPSAASLVVHHNMSILDRGTMEDLVMKRHSRSGLNLEFLSPDEPGPILTRRLSRAKSKEESQAILREVFFDRLHTQCGQNIMLSLFYWMSSISQDEAGTTVRVKPFSPLRFGFLAGHSLDQSLALKALLEHETLTVAEHASINGGSYENSMGIFESLGNALLIEPVSESTVRGRFELVVVDEKTSYRIRPLIVHPIIQYLRGKNIVH